ncbi:MAG: O-antigen polymerase [Berkelbacteria bacterium GW2011_GWA1_36_9]|uniref:O-antigen polymerase n=1 Tax=Berkelbacteria bacterium GW2011_GWA1_36_9 TaxID=1618331 RepID=A0A0G0I384_9BACT|nr:MAG: O-antigen polymerase [Berkelbacteria bacterium GW2011_GWA1_36_9]
MKGKSASWRTRNILIALFSVALALAVGFLIAKIAFLGLLLIILAVIALIVAYLVFRSPELGWLLIIFFLPFERVPSIEMAGVNLKINTFLGFLTLIAWILGLMFQGKKYKVQPNFLSIPLFLFIMALLLSLTQAFNFTRAVSVLIFTVFTIIFSILAVNMVYSKETLRKTILVLFFSALVVSLFGLFQFGGDVVGLPQSLTLLKEGYTSVVFGFPRVQAFSMEPLYFANYLLIPISVGLALFINRVEPIKRWWMAGLIGLILLNFILTVSRGGYLGLLGSFLVLGILLFKRLFNWRTILIGIVTVIIVVYGVAFALSKGETRATMEFLGHVTLQDVNRGESVEGRLITFKQGMNAFYTSPIFGIGLGNYGPWVTFYPDARPITGWPIVNNEFIELLAETGIVGAGTFLLLIIFLSVRTLMALKYAHDIFLKSVLIGLFAAFVGVLIQYNFMSTLYIIHVWVLIGLLVAVQNIILKNKITNF